MILSSSDRKRKEFLSEGMGIWAGEVRTVSVSEINLQQKSGIFRVEMGLFTISYSSMIISHPLLKDMRIHGGFNGKTSGEPHVVILITDEDMANWKRKCVVIDSMNNPLEIARTLACILGKDITFNLELFPHGVNVNIGLIQGNTIYMSTHERNIHSSRDTCIADQQKNGFCRCNTQACGTGGAAVANIALLLVPHMSTTITTIHPGGTIQYSLEYGYTTMIGNAHHS
jgi:diaminopimelate epimerase